MTWFSEGTAGFVYTAIRPQPVSLLCCTLLQWMHTQSLEGRSRQRSFFAQITREGNQKFSLYSKATTGENVERRRWNRKPVFSSVWLENIFCGGGKVPTSSHSCAFIEQGGTYSGWRKGQTAAFWNLCCAFHSIEEFQESRIALNRGDLDIPNFYFLDPSPPTQRIWYFFFKWKSCLNCAMQENSHSFCSKEEYW